MIINNNNKISQSSNYINNKTNKESKEASSSNDSNQVEDNNCNVSISKEAFELFGKEFNKELDFELSEDSLRKLINRENKSISDYEGIAKVEKFQKRETYSHYDESDYRKQMYNLLKDKVGSDEASDYVKNIEAMLNPRKRMGSCSMEEKAIIREIALKEINILADNFIVDEKEKSDFLEKVNTAVKNDILLEKGYVFSLGEDKEPFLNIAHVDRNYYEGNLNKDLIEEYADKDLYEKYKYDSLSDEEFEAFYSSIVTVRDGQRFSKDSEELLKKHGVKIDNAQAQAKKYLDKIDTNASDYLDKLKKIVDDLGINTKETNKLISGGSFSEIV